MSKSTRAGHDGIGNTKNEVIFYSRSFSSATGTHLHWSKTINLRQMSITFRRVAHICHRANLYCKRATSPASSTCVGGNINECSHPWTILEMYTCSSKSQSTITYTLKCTLSRINKFTISVYWVHTLLKLRVYGAGSQATSVTFLYNELVLNWCLGLARICTENRTCYLHWNKKRTIY